MHTVRDPKLNAMAMVIGPRQQKFLWEHLLWDAEHGAWNQVFCRSADLAAYGPQLPFKRQQLGRAKRTYSQG